MRYYEAAILQGGRGGGYGRYYEAAILQGGGEEGT